MNNNITEAISVHGITKTFDLNVAVNNVSFAVPKGEVVGFLGPNGSGKTTTMRMLTSFYTPDNGEIFIEGINNLTNDVEARSKIGYLPENNPLYGDMIVKEYLELIGKIRKLDKSKLMLLKENLELKRLIRGSLPLITSKSHSYISKFKLP